MSLVGSSFGRWVVVDDAPPYISPRGAIYAKYMCKCSCGNEKSVRESSLVNGDSQSCGCLAKEKARDRVKTHGLSKHPLYNVHHDMLRRCYDESRKDYKHYGGRGISVCESWKDSENGLVKFIEDMYSTFEDGLELDRIDVDGNYSKENCRWATRRIQVINRRQLGNKWDTHYLEFNGKRLCISQWGDELGINPKIIVDRIGKLGWSIDKALSTPVRIKRIYIQDRFGNEYSIDNIFKSPPNLYVKLKKFDVDNVQEFVACLLYDFEVGVVVDGGRYVIKPTMNLKSELKSIKLTDEFWNLIKDTHD